MAPYSEVLVYLCGPARSALALRIGLAVSRVFAVLLLLRVWFRQPAKVRKSGGIAAANPICTSGAKGRWADGGPSTPDLVATITAALERKFDQKFKSLKDPKTGQAAGQAPPPTAGDAAAGDDEQSQRGARIESLEKALRQIGDVAGDDPAKQCFESQLRDARKAQRDAKPVSQQRTNVAFRLQTAQKKQSKAGEAVAAQQKLIEEAQRSLHEFELHPELLEAEGNADVKEVMSIPIFAKYQQLFKGQQQDSKVLQVELLMHQ
ncbi:unnamed protein product, partial [Prorocentrum cordatum]